MRIAESLVNLPLNQQIEIGTTRHSSVRLITLVTKLLMPEGSWQRTCNPPSTKGHLSCYPKQSAFNLERRAHRSAIWLRAAVGANEPRTHIK